MDIMRSFFYITSIIFMFIFSFIGIWGFINFIQMQKHLRYQNQLSEKINQNLSNLARIHTTSASSLKEIATNLKKPENTDLDEELLNVTNELVDINNNKKIDIRKI